MPRRTKGPRLHWRERKDGPSLWEIRDGQTRISTGTDSRSEAEIHLAGYISRKHRPTGPVAPSDLTVAQALTIYAEEHAATVADPARIGYAISALDRFWGDLPTSDITGPTCRRYANARGVSIGTVRRELGVLQAALNHCDKEGYLTAAPTVTLPAPPPSQERWLTRREAAWLLRAARSLNADGRHLADFILHGLYTGSRKATILAMHINTPSIVGGHVDTVNGLLFRKPVGKVGTKKRQGTARLPNRYLAHLRRQASNGRAFVVERRITRSGKTHREMVGDIRKSWAAAVPLAEEMASTKGININLTMATPTGQKRITPHVLKHTAITWALQRGATIWDAAGYFSTSPETIQKVYGHHSPDHQATAVAAMDRRF